MTADLLEYDDDLGNTYQGYISLPASEGPSPCIFVLHDWSGASKRDYELADAFARLGYVGFAVDLYGKGKRGLTQEECAALMQPFVDNRQRIVDVFSHALAIAERHPRIDSQSLAAVGFCFGGQCALDLARWRLPLKGVVSVHGVLGGIPGYLSPAIGARILVLHGSADPIAPISQLQSLAAELDQVSADWRLHLFGGVRHAFTNPAARDAALGIEYHPSAHAQASHLTEQFLRDVFIARASQQESRK